MESKDYERYSYISYIQIFQYFFGIFLWLFYFQKETKLIFIFPTFMKTRDRQTLFTTHLKVSLLYFQIYMSTIEVLYPFAWSLTLNDRLLLWLEWQSIALAFKTAAVWDDIEIQNSNNIISMKYLATH